MGCVATKLEEEGEVVAICRDRKRLLKLAVERRRALAVAHFRYCQALYAVSSAIKLFVARHASPSLPFMITFPASSSLTPESVANGSITTTTAMFLQQKPSESTSKSEAVKCPSCGSSESSDDEGCHNGLLHAEEQPYSYYMRTPPPMPSPPRDFGWDFFNLFDAMRPEVVSRYTKTTSYDEDLRVLRHQEGIPEIEEEAEEDKKVVVVEEESRRGEVSDSKEVEMVTTSMDGLGFSSQERKSEFPENSRELLEALRDIESHFMRAYDSGKDVCRMLEANSVHLQSGREELKVNPTKLIQAITWHRSGSCKSLVASSSTWSEYKNDLFDEYGGMVSGSHSLTLGRLYAWEKKLYEEVKAGDGVRKLYERKCTRLRSQDVRVDNRFKPDKTRAAVKDLYARILVSIRTAESISGKIEKLRDEELQPQIIELLKGLSSTWKTMLDTHETQKKILSEVGTFDCPLYDKFGTDSHRLATLQLEAELHNWRSCLAEYVSAQKSYVETLHRWLTKFLAPEIELYSRSGKHASASPYRANGPGLLPICHEWLSLLEKLPDKSVGFALKSFAKELRALRAMQGEEQQQKRKVETLVKEIDKRAQVFNKMETQLLEYRPTKEKHEPNEPDPIEALRRRVEVEREKHQKFVQEAKWATLTGFRAGFCAVFERLTEFGSASQKMYNEIAMYGEKVEKSGSGDGDEGSR